MKKKVVCLILSCLLILSAFPVIGMAEEEGRIMISDVQGFLDIRKAPDRDYIITVSELNFSGVTDFTPFDTFTGSLTCSAAGGKCVIQNLTVDCANAKTGAGLFNYLCGSVDGLIIDKSCSLINTTNAQHIGMIAGYAGVGGTISNCTNYADISANTAWPVAGILGTAFAKVGETKLTNCVNYGNISNANAFAAGIVGMSNAANAASRLEDCYNYGTITSATGAAGGIFGYINKAGTVSLLRCLNQGNVKAGTMAGGLIAGCMYNSFAVIVELTECASVGNLNGGSSTGGLMGAFTRYTGSFFTADSCYVRGEYSSDVSSARVCGLLGEWNYKFVPDLTVRNCYLAVTFAPASGSAYAVSANNNQDTGGTFAHNFFQITAKQGTVVYGGYPSVPLSSFSGITEVENAEKLTNAMTENGLIGENGHYYASSAEVNNGYPVLKWQGECTHDRTVTTCSEKTCLNCGKILETYENGAHTFGDWTVRSEATVVFNRVRSRTCSACNFVEEAEDENTATGTINAADGIYSVKTAQELLWLTHHVSSGNIRLENDIVIDQTLLKPEGEDYRFEGLGLSDNGFDGVFDGNGKTLTLETDGGLFDNLGNCTVKNLTIKSQVKNAETTRCIGALADRVTGNAEVTNVHVTGNINGFYCGGLIGVVESGGSIRLEKCENQAQVWAYALDNINGSAGIVGFICSDSADNRIDSCRNTGLITSSGSLVAGIAGRVQYGSGSLTVTNCVNTGKIACYGANQSGGIVGFVNYTVTVDHCINSGLIVGTTMGSGGIVGRCNANTNQLTVRNSINLGKVDASLLYGGIVGYLSVGNRYEFENNASVTTVSGAGGNDASASSGVQIGFHTSMSFRLDDMTDGVTVRFKVTYPTETVEKYGITVGAPFVGRSSDEEFETWLGTGSLKKEVSGDQTILTLTAVGLPETYLNHDLTVRAELSCNGVTGHYEASISFAAAAAQLVEKGYPSADGERLPEQFCRLLDEWMAVRKTVVMIGDSITDGARSTLGNHRTWAVNYDRDVTYPGRLQALLGSAYRVINCGYSGRSMCTNIGNISYTSTQEYTEALSAKPDIAFIMLGTNDADTNNVSVYGDAFEQAYRSEYVSTAKRIVDELVAANPDVQIYFCTSPESYRTAQTAPLASVNATRAANTQVNLTIVRKWQAEVVTELQAQGYRIELFDMYDVTNDWSADPENLASGEILQYFSNDLLHPNDRGYEYMAKAVYNKIFQ